MAMNRVVLTAVVLGIVGAARAAHAQACCTEMAAYDGESGSQACTDGVNNWTCPAVRTHYPVQRFCDNLGIGPMACNLDRAPVNIPVFSVRCGTFQNKCPDGLVRALPTTADNDLCSGRCLGRIGASPECQQRQRERLKEQAEELERLLQEATSPPQE